LGQLRNIIVYLYVVELFPVTTAIGCFTHHHHMYVYQDGQGCLRFGSLCSTLDSTQCINKQSNNFPVLISVISFGSRDKSKRNLYAVTLVLYKDLI
jgi:hypothetical protein